MHDTTRDDLDEALSGAWVHKTMTEWWRLLADALGTTPEVLDLVAAGEVVASITVAPKPQQCPPECYWLYHLFGRNDRLLYVGITRNLKGRLKAHHKRWGDVIVRVEHTEFDSHVDVLAAEAREIAEKCPPFNSDGIGA